MVHMGSSVSLCLMSRGEAIYNNTHGVIKVYMCIATISLGLECYLPRGRSIEIHISPNCNHTKINFPSARMFYSSIAIRIIVNQAEMQFIDLQLSNQAQKQHCKDEHRACSLVLDYLFKQICSPKRHSGENLRRSCLREAQLRKTNFLACSWASKA